MAVFVTAKIGMMRPPCLGDRNGAGSSHAAHEMGDPVPSQDHRIFARAILAGVLVAAVGLSACGRRGPLEAPPGAAAAPADPAAPQGDAIPKPDRPFILDPLL
jgi:predicted small lipoprotein YifL